MIDRALRIGLTVGVALAAFPTPATAQEPGADEIRAVRQASNTALAVHDVHALAATWLDDVNVTGSSGAVYVGGAAMAEAFESSFADPEFVTYQRTPDEVAISTGGMFGAESGHWIGIWNKPDGEMRLRGVYLAQWQQHDGNWRVRSEVFIALGCVGSNDCAVR
jgi:ketosteroid isomerase-like protein